MTMASPASLVSPGKATARASEASTPRMGLVKFVKLAEWLILLIALAYLGGRSLPRPWQSLKCDFPSYYLTARLLREGYNTDRLFEWIWLQRQKDHIGIDQAVVGFVPNPPSAVFPVLPLTYWAPLTAKHIWIIINMALLAAIAVLLQSITSIGLRR